MYLFMMYLLLVRNNTSVGVLGEQFKQTCTSQLRSTSMEWFLVIVYHVSLKESIVPLTGTDVSH